MNQGESTDTTAPLDSTSLEKHQIVGSHQINASYYSPNGAVVSWSTQDQSSKENGVLSNSGYNHDQRVEPTLRNVEDGTNVASNNSTSSSGITNGPQGYSGYAAYPNADPYGYSNTGYAAHYNQYQQQSNDYQQPSNQYQQPSSQYQQPSSQYQQPSNQYQQPSIQYQQPSSQYQQPSNQYQQPSNQYQQPSNQYQQPPNQSYTHHLGAYQNTGAPYQPISSFPNSGSYPAPASYSSTYYSPGDYQTSGSYTSGTYGTQANLWHGGQYAAYSSHQYPNYTSDSNSAYSSSTPVAASQYQQHYKQWEDYYNKTQTEVSCAPGTESTSAPSASSVSCSVPSGTSEYAATNQPPTAYTTSWRPVSSSSELSSVQPATVSGSLQEAYWKHGSTVFQSDPPTAVQPHIQNPPDVNPTYGSFQNQPNTSFSQAPIASYSASYQVSQHHQPSFQTFSQPPEHLDSRKGSKLQIPTNPRIAANLSVGVQKTDKDSSMTSTAVKPAYIGVSVQPNVKVTSQDEADSMLKPGTFPKSLRGYVERALARCKDDRQKAASQDIMKEVITRATADGTLYSRDWDTEPLFAMPNIDAVKDDMVFPILNSTMANNRRSPSRRAKSRWEPVPDEKPINKYANTPNATAKYGVWNKQFSGGKSENKSLQAKSPLSDQKSVSKNVGRPAKRQRLGTDPSVAGGDEGSSDSDKGHSLTKYYAAALALADSPEEKKRRENRSKRFDKGRGNRVENNNIRGKNAGASNSYARRPGALVASRTFEESGSRAVEDIDWDALRVKGTCQEIEKRYLRLTSAPDPATVRPEEVLEKALLMVQNSQKNYLYKCDQLKSIRQDLTVQHIRNELTVKVYETHARTAIEVGDMPEYNQCQSQLKSLYAEGIRGCHMEFAAYNLLRVILHPNNNRDLLSAMSRLSAESKKDKAVRHALSVRTAVTSGNYVMFFRLYKTAPNLNTFLMDLYVEKMRYAAVKCISRSYRPTVPVSYLSEILGFGSALPTSETSDDKDLDGVEECIEWLKAHGACFTSENSEEMLLDTKASVSSLFMPEAEDAVAHGDANLAVNDFFTRNLVQTN